MYIDLSIVFVNLPNQNSELDQQSQKQESYSKSAKIKAGIAAGLSAIYLLNLSFGILEIPDNLPIIGNLDELAASMILISSLKAFGLDWSNVLPFLRLRNKS